jgi:hypothetical protein
MSKNSQQTNLNSAGLFSKSQFVLFTALFMGLTLSACSSSGSNKKSSSSSSSSSSQNRSPEFQKRLQAESDAEDARDRNAKVQEQTRLEELELMRLRADRAAQRNAQREADAEKEKQQ